MFTNKYFDVSSVNLNFNLVYSISYRSNTIHDVAKHCYEGTYLNGGEGFHFGFTNKGTDRHFFSYWGDITPLFYYTSGISYKYDYFDLKVNQGC